ncbi:MAG: hypothetical protein JXX14_10890 [Deltaproteobacteria bacterium]|nr:hypothetical protein [Deltaproteobacteria bacterium]
MRISTLQQELDLLQAEHGKKLSWSVLPPAIGSFIDDVMQYLALHVDIQYLDETALRSEQRDIEAVKDVVTLLARSIDKSDTIKLPEGGAIEAAKVIQSLETAIIQLEHADSDYGKEGSNILLRADVGNHVQQALLFLRNKQVIQKLTKSVHAKLGEASNEDVADVWASVRYEFDTSRTATHMVPNKTVMGDNFLIAETVSSMRKKISDYVVRIKPSLIRLMLDEGKNRHPAQVPELTYIIGMPRPIAGLKPVERRIVDCIACLYHQFGLLDQRNIKAMLSLSDDGWICKGYAQKSRFRKLCGIEGSRDVGELPYFWLKRLLLYLEEYISWESPVERALLQYKLSVEVLRGETIKMTPFLSNELKIQKHLCKFLIERNIFAVGTKFGNTETDLVCQAKPVSYIVEVKYFRSNSDPDDSKIQSALLQLRQYMDLHPTYTKGVLVFFNKSSCPISAERKWIDGRYMILAVNMYASSPSKLKEGIDIIASNDSQLIICRNLGKKGTPHNSSTKKKTTAKKRTTAKKKTTTKKKTTANK